MRKIIYANDFAECEGKLRLFSIGHSENVNKADAFVICYNKEVYLIDGGHVGTFHCLDFLLNLRKSYLSKNRKFEKDIDCKLRINLLVSHFHIDHVDALISNIAVNAFIDIADVYLPDEGKLSGKYGNVSRSGDVVYRPYLLKILRELHPHSNLNVIKFGEENVTEITQGDMTLTLYPSPFDFSSDEHVEFMLDIYGKERDRDAIAEGIDPSILPNIDRHTTTYTLNANSLWMHFKIGENSFLFTGDSMKRLPNCDGEALDIYMRAYRERIGKVSVLKYVHHGYVRNSAATAMLSFDPEYVLLTTQFATGDEAIRRIDPDTKIKFVNSGLQTVLFECDAHSGIELKYINEN